MDNIRIEVDDSSIQAILDTLPAEVHAALLKKIQALRLEVQSHIQRDELSGQKLHVITGDLRRSIYSGVDDKGDTIEGWVKQSGDVKYGAILEFGGTVHIPEIVPIKAKALHWVHEGKDVFAKHARAHDVTIPEFRYMRSGLEDMHDKIVSGIKEAMLNALTS